MYSTLIHSDSLVLIDSKPSPDSFDSAHEFSLARLLEVYRLVNLEDEELEGYVFDDECLYVS